MNGISPLSAALHNLNSNILQTPSTSDGTQVTFLSVNAVSSSTKVTLSDDARYQSLLSDIRLNTVSSVGGTNTKSLKVILDLSFSIGVQSDSDLRFLDDKPETDDAGRLSLAQEAADYIKGSQAQNPFEGLSRQTLSSVAYERSGAWTTAERLSAYWQMNKLDGEYGNEVFYKTQSIDDYDVATVNLMTELKKIQGMSEAEKNEKMITKDSIKEMQDKVEKSQVDNKDKLLQYTPLDYKNLVKSDLTDLLVAKATGHGGYRWETGSSAQLFDSMTEKNEKINISSLVLLAG